MIESTKLNHKPHKIYLEAPAKCARPIKAHICGSTRFLVYDEPVRLRGVVCRRYRCHDCNADYFVVVEPVLVPISHG